MVLVDLEFLVDLVDLVDPECPVILEHQLDHVDPEYLAVLGALYHLVVLLILEGPVRQVVPVDPKDPEVLLHLVDQDCPVDLENQCLALLDHLQV